MATYLGDLNNRFNDSAFVRGMGGSDLGVPYHRKHDNTWGYLFGDSFRGIGQSGEYFGSPIIMCQQTFNPNALINFTYALRNNRAEQLMNYNHFADNGYRWEVTRIPNDAIEVGTRTYMQLTSVHNWTPGPETDGANLGMLWYSDDYGNTWKHGISWLGNEFGNKSPFMQWSFAHVDDLYVYILANRWNGSHRNNVNTGPILMRANKNDMLNQSPQNYQNWKNGAWVNGDQGFTPVFNATNENLGEHSVKKVGDRFVIAYFDQIGYCISTRTAPTLAGPWTNPKKQVHGQRFWGDSYPQLYGGAIHPGSPSLDNVSLIVSQWNTSTGNPYRAMHFNRVNVL